MEDIIMATAPCKGCKDRVTGCHSKCDRYKDFQVENERIKELRRKDTESYAFYVATQMRMKRQCDRHMRSGRK